MLIPTSLQRPPPPAFRSSGMKMLCISGGSGGEEILTYNTDPQVIDTDLDGFSDGYEVNTGYDPALASSTPDTVMSIYTAVEIHFNAA